MLQLKQKYLVILFTLWIHSGISTEILSEYFNFVLFLFLVNIELFHNPISISLSYIKKKKIIITKSNLFNIFVDSIVIMIKQIIHCIIGRYLISYLNVSFIHAFRYCNCSSLSEVILVSASGSTVCISFLSFSCLSGYRLNW